MDDVMLTTFDNPFNPFEQFNEWFLFDIEKNYYSCSRLARIFNQYYKMTDDLTDNELNAMIEDSINKVINLDVLNVYKKVKRSDYLSN